MELPIAVIVLGLVGVLTLLAVRRIGPGSLWRLRIPGLILIGLGIALFGSQLPPTPMRLLLGSMVLIAWGGVGLALVAGRAWAIVPGLLLASLGFVVAAWVDVRVDPWANEAMLNGIERSADRVLVDVFFLADGPSYSWLEVTYGAIAFAVLSAVAGGFLVLDMLEHRRQAPSPPRSSS
jgi:hypothetical protein